MAKVHSYDSVFCCVKVQSEGTKEHLEYPPCVR